MNQSKKPDATPNFIRDCMDRTEKVNRVAGIFKPSQFIVDALVDRVELCKRLDKACNILRRAALTTQLNGTALGMQLEETADELEAV